MLVSSGTDHYSLTKKTNAAESTGIPVVSVPCVIALLDQSIEQVSKNPNASTAVAQAVATNAVVVSNASPTSNAASKKKKPTKTIKIKSLQHIEQQKQAKTIMVKELAKASALAESLKNEHFSTEEDMRQKLLELAEDNTYRQNMLKSPLTHIQRELTETRSATEKLVRDLERNMLVDDGTGSGHMVSQQKKI